MNDKKPLIYFRDLPHIISEDAVKEMLHEMASCVLMFDKYNFENLSFEKKVEHIAALQELARELNDNLRRNLPKA